MACEQFTSLGSSWEQYKFVEGVVCTYSTHLSGLQVVAMLVYAAIGGALWIRTRSLAIPANLLLLLGSVMISQMAAPGAQFAALILLTLFGIGTVLIVRHING